ncbi:type IX secretion system ring subunit PorN/GldN [Flavisolibacter ginsengisoli]|uniref:Gliding motility associated protien GldN n=1 Tax=Flavisolibacter ginsengisoli DSM 18119 TaxID=1121884 RepID=A0A1M4VW27_9BACT|nr:gliding motility protein GldN [Flavisolibacter ginsengisoli]SHE73063.1 gliding motility associated protien GldN [Flavisolibacter ginsengisoli DSM 18119]
MKNHMIKVCFSLVLGLMFMNADAQRASRKRAANAPATQGVQQTEQTQDVKPPSGYNPYGNIPIERDSTSNTNGVVKKSLRPDGAVDKSFINERTPLPYENLRWDDALYSEKVWRELDLREKMNQPFRFEAEDDNGSQMFFDILMNAIKKDSVVAFSDDRFTTPLAEAEMGNLTSGGPLDTNAVRDPNDPNKIVKWVVSQESFDPKAITKLRIKEEWVFDREASRLFVRILGIAPVKTIQRGNSTQNEVMFWVYYPDLRKTLAKYEVYNPKNLGYGRMTWEELFESRMFSSYITKSTLDNPGNKVIRQMIKDPILALLEGDNIKERIFNYEQDLWSY